MHRLLARGPRIGNQVERFVGQVCVMALTGKKARRVRHEMSQEQKSRCCYCERPFGKKGSPREATIEHIIPQCLGGTDNRGNLAAACITCNRMRGKLLHRALADFSGISC